MSGNAPRDQRADDSAPSTQLDEVVRELRELRALMDDRRPAAGDDAPRGDTSAQIQESIEQTRRALAALQGTDAAPSETEWSLMARELGAVVDGAQRASEQILSAAEEIDQAANTLSASTQTEHEQGLANDIRDQVIHIYEACNFHDLSSQRIAKVRAALARIEAQVAHIADMWRQNPAPAAPADRKPARHANTPPAKKRTARSAAQSDQSDRLTQAEIDAMFD